MTKKKDTIVGRHAITLKPLSCPHCGKSMLTRIQNRIHHNKSTKRIEKMKWHQYYCPKCDDGDSGWTTEESDTESLKLN